MNFSVIDIAIKPVGLWFIEECGQYMSKVDSGRDY